MDVPSTFHALFEAATPFTLSFPAIDGVGPTWREDGELIGALGDEHATEGIEAVEIGPGQYRLVCRSAGPFSGLRLHCGDEFIATAGARSLLTLTGVMAPQPYAHQRFLTPTTFSNQHPAADLVHELEGGWESVAGGMLTLTVSAARSAEFLRRMTEAGIAPEILRLLD